MEASSPEQVQPDYYSVAQDPEIRAAGTRLNFVWGAQRIEAEEAFNKLVQDKHGVDATGAKQVLSIILSTRRGPRTASELNGEY